MLKFITALLVSQVLLAAPVPGPPEVTDMSKDFHVSGMHKKFEISHVECNTY